jgi:hypothetical protein
MALQRHPLPRTLLYYPALQNHIDYKNLGFSHVATRVIAAWSQSVPHALGDNGQPKAEHHHHDDVINAFGVLMVRTLMVQLGGPVAKRMNRAQIGTKRAFI